MDFELQMLARLKADCDYYLGNGYAFEGHLWAGTVEKQIEKMRVFYMMLKEKPKWLTMEQIENYYAKMMEVKNLKKRIQEEFLNG